MNRIFLITFLSLVSVAFRPSLAGAQGTTSPIKWYTIEEAQRLQAQDPKPILIDLYTDWCGYCKRLDVYTFSNKTIAGYLSKHFYPVKFNAEQREAVVFSGKTFENTGNKERSPHDLAIALTGGKLSYPTLIYLNKESKVVSVVPGYCTPSQLEPILHYIADEAYNEKGWEEYLEHFKGSF